ncbi:MAG: hypothetical protein J6N73_01640 [Prevotella sp.]|nr:hypothetical protein [Prevotella sp.]
MKTIKIILLLLLVCANIGAQRVEDGYFIYEDDSRSAIVGLTMSGIANVLNFNELTIPEGVIAVRQGAFSNFSAYGAELNTLIVEGNTCFEKADESGVSSLDESTADGIQSSITTIQMGSNMSQENMRALLLCMESRHDLEKVEISGNVGSVSWTDDAIKAVLTSEVSVDLPATMVANQVFGDAKVYGIFTINYDYSTMCVGATFVDMDDGSNFLFYIPTETVEGEKKVRCHRVHYINANQGILLHRESSTADRARLLRIDDVSEYVDGLDGTAATIYNADKVNYENNMLRGSVNPQTIGATDGEYTNMVLYNDAFVPTSGETLGANKAYLRIPTSYLGGGASGAKVFMALDSDVTGIVSAQPTDERNGDAVYDLQGRKVAEGSPSSATSKTLPRGIYIHNGKKITIK